VCRDRSGLSQEELAARAGCHRNYVGKVERAELNPSAKKLLALARELHVAPAEFWIEYPDGNAAD